MKSKGSPGWFPRCAYQRGLLLTAQGAPAAARAQPLAWRPLGQRDERCPGNSSFLTSSLAASKLYKSPAQGKGCSPGRRGQEHTGASSHPGRRHGGCRLRCTCCPPCVLNRHSPIQGAGGVDQGQGSVSRGIPSPVHLVPGPPGTQQGTNPSHRHTH